MSPSIESLDLSSAQDPNHEMAHALVAQGIATRVRVVSDDGYVLFEAWDHAIDSPSYAWRVPLMPAPAFWPKQRRSSRA